ncbi:LysR family transcriptional regulator [Lentilactobacillus sp. IMAU92037]|uniref:LysR family transcriptional regulator n=1 Tax=Lentilactobacillus TaxID=2767893 RepID=UPI001C27BF6D|nr:MULTISPECIES: LysR family transcriptional regulator [Lentilactobacillus]MBU9790064.1 LysR family transcriptional regulator [Lentilactobacillus dabitei]MBV0931172.1 LysR family transcriptional regulator [Lentilactobacillus dabitei]MDM7517331.1 LysR family transcriptional regulator [Lentilactobacillus sp. TOM.63]
MAIDLELLRELVAFQKYGTLSATAEHLMITQPTVTRGMKKLEQQLDVTLFDRQVSNHIQLNDSGQFAVGEAEKLLKAESDFTGKVRNYDRSKNEIAIASVAPGPILLLNQIKDKIESQLNINDQTIKLDEVIDRLQTFNDRLIFTNQEITTDDIESMYLGGEYLGVGIDKFNPLSQQQHISFADLAGLSFLVVQDIGPWRQIVEEQIHNASFLYQEDLNAMSQISRYSNFPFFFSNLSQVTSTTGERFKNNNRNPVRIDDPHNKIEFYGAYLKRERETIQPILRIISQNWPK